MLIDALEMPSRFPIIRYCEVDPIIKEMSQPVIKNRPYSGINQMWILKNSKQLLDSIQTNSITSINSIKTFDF